MGHCKLKGAPVIEGWGCGMWGVRAGREGRKAKKAALTFPVPLQVLRGGDPAEGQDLPADADGEGGNAHQGGPAWGPHVSAPLPGGGAGESARSDSSWVPERPFQAPSGGWGLEEEVEERAYIPSTGSSSLPPGTNQGLLGPQAFPRAPLLLWV